MIDLRHPLAVSKLEELAQGTFQNAIGEIDALDPKGVKRVVRILEIISEEELARIAPKK